MNLQHVDRRKLLIGGAALAVVAFVILKGKSAGGTAALDQVVPSQDPNAATLSPGGGGGGTVGIDYTGQIQATNDRIDTLQQALSDYTAAQYYGSGSYAHPATDPTAAPTVSGASGQQLATAPGNARVLAATPGFRTSASSPDFAGQAKVNTAAAKQAGKPAPFGGVVSVTKTKTGGTLTKYKSGRVVQQERGKSAYVVHK